ncbi:hypothetical protein [Paraburkholderia hospita]|uniref:hypothetical protein n=1 Tax=Paraburkholderia hospita TaxID=169430 RepID=UPI003ECDABF8
MKNDKASKKQIPIAAKKEMRLANDHQIRIYFSRFDRFWRLHKLIAMKHLLASREGFRAVVREVYEGQGVDDLQLVYGNITNGILADATSELAMLCEDYFALLRFIREPLYFVKRAVNYKAGSVTTLSKALRHPTDDMLRRMFFIPSPKIMTSVFAEHSLASANENINALAGQLNYLRELHDSAMGFHEKHKDFHVQYKHGLKLALSGLHESLPDAEIDRRKREFSAPLFAFENKPMSELGYESAMFIPGFGYPSIGNNLGKLHGDLNLLHIQFLHDVDIDNWISLARKVVKLINFLISNRLSIIDNEGVRKVRFLLPDDNSDEMKSRFYDLDVPAGHEMPTIFTYQLDV